MFKMFKSRMCVAGALIAAVMGAASLAAVNGGFFLAAAAFLLLKNSKKFNDSLPPCFFVWSTVRSARRSRESRQARERREIWQMRRNRGVVRRNDPESPP